MIANFAFAVARIQQRGDRSSQRGGVVCGTELPAVRKVDGDQLSRPDATGDQAAGPGLDCFSIFGVGQAASTGTVHQRRLLRVAAAGVEHKIVHKEVVGIRVELPLQHAGQIVMEKARFDRSSPGRNRR